MRLHYRAPVDPNFAVAVIGTLAALASAWFAYIAVRGKIRRRTPNTTTGPSPTTGPYDAFISYAPQDEPIAHQLHTRGIHVFLAKWIGIGLVEYAEKENALTQTANGILLFSHTTMTDPAIRDEYAALLQRIHTGGRRFIPVLVEDVELPPFARIRKPLDLTSHHEPANLDALTRAVRTT